MAQLSNYANFLGDRYLGTGNISDLEESIHIFVMVCGRVAEEEVYLDRHKCLSNFGIQLSRSKSKNLSNLAIILKHEHFKTDDPEVLEEAISVHRKAVEAVYKNYPDVFATFHNLATLLTTKYKLTQRLEDLEEALRLGRQAVDLTPEDYANRAARLNTLAVQLSDMSKKTGLTSHLNDAIHHGQKALDVTGESHPDRANRLVNQGGRYGDLFWKTRGKQHFDTWRSLTRNDHSFSCVIDAIRLPDTFMDDYKNRANAAKVAKMRVAEDLTYTDLGVFQQEGPRS
ncbi:hypothetical protein FMUND_433 [Fusarium mundagurra]|uniref:Uncharacterized protein n=1 Tax=Fusarium mundagurra TaxID=1567541 RepID=A0A8H5Z889_9HYPO|nr:hypothetical protein FMUND_433 [Fusarium mundagurra]